MPNSLPNDSTNLHSHNYAFPSLLSTIVYMVSEIQTKISKRIPYSPSLSSCLNNGENKSPILLLLRRHKSSSLYYILVYIPEHISCNSKEKTVWQFIYCLALVLKDIMLTVLLCVGVWKLKVDPAISSTTSIQSCSWLYHNTHG